MENMSTGPFLLRSTCRRCLGTGTIVRMPCSQCSGHGKIIGRHSVKVSIPAGLLTSYLFENLFLYIIYFLFEDVGYDLHTIDLFSYYLFFSLILICQTFY